MKDEAEARLEHLLQELHEKLPVNHQLKQELRLELCSSATEQEECGHEQHFASEREELLHSQDGTSPDLARDPHSNIMEIRSLYYWRQRVAQYGMAAAALVILVGAVLWWGIGQKESARVYAAELKLVPQYDRIQQLGTDPSTSAVYSDDKLYVAIPNEGIYKQEAMTSKLIMKGRDIDSLRISPDGKQLAYVSSAGLYLMDLKSEHTELLLSSDQGRLRDLAWAIDSDKLLLVKETGTQSQIWELNVETRQEQFLVEGTHPTYRDKQGSLLYEREGHIYAWDKQLRQSTLFLEGTQPVVSPDGQYVLYVKQQGEERLDDMWVTDIDHTTAQKLTNNYLLPVSDDWSWDMQGEWPAGPKRPQYTISELTWSPDGKDIIYYQTSYANPEMRQMVRLVESQHKQRPEDVVASMVEALMYRDEALAHQYFSYNPGYMKGTSPRQVDYRIRQVTKQSDGRAIVEADIMYGYQDPYYRLEHMQFELLPDAEQGYLISRMELSSSTTISSFRGDVVQDYATEEVLLQLDEVPVEAGWVNRKFEQLLYDDSDGRVIWFILSQEQEQGGGKRMRLMKMNLNERSFETYGAIDGAEHVDVLYVDEASGYAAANFAFADGDDILLLPIKDEDIDAAGASRTSHSPQTPQDSEAQLLSMREQLKSVKPEYMTIRMFKLGKLVFRAVVSEGEIEGVSGDTERDLFFTYELK